MSNPPLIVAFGGGTNSTALLVGLMERGRRPDLILFADTGGERPYTYAYVDVLSAWLSANGFPEIVTVRYKTKAGDAVTLEQRCLDTKSLPSIAYGYKSCSEKFKRRPQDKFVNTWPPAIAAWKRGEKCVKLIGYDADEDRRVRNAPKSDNKYVYEYPLYEWGWDREDCVDAIKRAGLPLPGKSACFFCPSSKKHEIESLAAEHPDLLMRALVIEATAETTSVKGLGRGWSWVDFLSSRANAQHLREPDDVPCGCFDG